MAGNFHLSPNAYSSGFDSDDSENAPIISFTQGVRDLPPKRIRKKTKSKALDDEVEGSPKTKRAPLKDKNGKKAQPRAGTAKKTGRSPRKEKFGASPKPKKMKKKKLATTAHNENADVGDEKQDVAAGKGKSSNDENDENDASRINQVRTRREWADSFEGLRHEEFYLYCDELLDDDDSAEKISANDNPIVAENDDSLVEEMLAPVPRGDGDAPLFVGPRAPAANEGVAPQARAQLLRAPPLAAQAAPAAAPYERAPAAPAESDSDEVPMRARVLPARDPRRRTDDCGGSEDHASNDDSSYGVAPPTTSIAASNPPTAPAGFAEHEIAESDDNEVTNDERDELALEGLGLPALRKEMGNCLLPTLQKGVMTLNNWWRAEEGVLAARLAAGRILEESVPPRSVRGDGAQATECPRDAQGSAREDAPDAARGDGEQATGARDAQGSVRDAENDDDVTDFENAGLFKLLLKRLPDSAKVGSGFGTFCEVDANDKAIMLERFVERARKVRSGQSLQRYCPNSMRVLLNSINGAFNARARIMKANHPEKRTSSALISFSWCNMHAPEAALFKGVRDALKGERKDFRKTGAKRGKGASSATSAINVIQLKRIREVYEDWGMRLKRDGAKAEMLPGVAVKKTGVNAYGRRLETEIALATLDMGTFGGGRAVSDYSLYRVKDIIFVSNGYWVFSGDWRKTDRIGSNGNYIGRGPFFVPDVDGSLDRMKLIVSGRLGIDGFDKRGVPIAERLFLRPLKGAVEGGECIWRREVVGFGSWDPVAEVSAWCEENEGWSHLRRTLGSLRYMLETGLIRAGTPMRIASGFIGHEVNGFDQKCADRRIKDYTYALGNTMLDIDRVLLIIMSGFTIKWEESDKLVDPDVVEKMIDEGPEEITPHMFDEETREQNIVLRSGFVSRATNNPFMRAVAGRPGTNDPFMRAGGPGTAEASRHVYVSHSSFNSSYAKAATRTRMPPPPPRRQHFEKFRPPAREPAAAPRRADDYGGAEVYASNYDYGSYDDYGSSVARSARAPTPRAAPPSARALYDGDGNFVCWQPPRAMHGAARGEPAEPPRRADDDGGAEDFASNSGTHDDYGTHGGYGGDNVVALEHGARKESLAMRMLRAQHAFAELAERRARDRARGGAGYHGNDEHDDDDEGEFYVPPTQAD